MRGAGDNYIGRTQFVDVLGNVEISLLQSTGKGGSTHAACTSGA